MGHRFFRRFWMVVAPAQMRTIQLVNALRKVLQKSGVFYLGVRDWDALPAAQRTYNQFRTHFTAANKRRIVPLPATHAIIAARP